MSIQKDRTDRDKIQDKNPPGGAWDTGSSVDKNNDAKILLEICYHPAASRPWAVVLSVMVILATSFASYLVFQQMLLPVLVILFMVVTNTSFFFPSRYSFTEEKLTVDRIIYRKTFPWSRFRGYSLDGNGLYLSPSSDPERFDRFRGVFLVMDKSRQQKAIPVLKEVIGEPGPR